jgi:hypothetical protein
VDTQPPRKGPVRWVVPCSSVQPLTLEDVLLFLDQLRLDPERQHNLRQGIDLLHQAKWSGVIPDLDAWEFKQRMVEARRIGWIEWTQPEFDQTGRDLANAREFWLTDAGIKQARDLKGLPRWLLVAEELEGCSATGHGPR